MSLQQVNLYLPEFRTKREWLTASSLLASFVGIIAIYVIFYFVAVANLASLEKQTVALENRQLAAQKQMEKFKAQSRPFKNDQVELQLNYLRTALIGRQQVEKIIEWQNLGNSEGFSTAFQGLARQSFDSISLQKFSMSPRLRGGQLLQVKGVTEQPEDIATYIQQLRQEPTFAHVNFGLLSVAADKNSTYHLFTLGYDSVYRLAVKGEEK
ncbi:PilN domain-containing protein [Teredinibacter franksiae]|uniref:PilN domain-containing protein n=1 Tax=Teredinibacter franksiae TaxID=2761453 RepID=UPI001629771D|nr:PilN domain-containing protein [Teredinibacter franksiae]